MSCQTCMIPPKGVFGRFIGRVQIEKVVQHSYIRVVYIESDVNTLRMDGALSPRRKNDTSYFEIESGDKVLSLENRGKQEISSDIFPFQPNQYYTIVVFKDYILQLLEEDLQCPKPGFVRLQAYNLDGDEIDVYLDEETAFENLGNDDFMERIIPNGIYDLRISSDPEFFYELELESGVIYTIFFIFDSKVVFVVDNEYCQNVV